MILEAENYRDVLKNQIHSRIERNPLYSGNCFSKKIGISQSYLSLILNGKRNLSPKAAKEIADNLGFTPFETDYFQLLVKRDNATTDEETERYKKEIRNLKKDNSVEETWGVFS